MKVSTPVPGGNQMGSAIQMNLSSLDLPVAYRAGDSKAAFDNRDLREIVVVKEEGKTLSDERYRKLKEDLEKNSGLLRFLNERLRFSVHEETKRLQVSILDGTTDEVIKKIPPDELLNVIARLREMKGILIDEKK